MSPRQGPGRPPAYKLASGAVVPGVTTIVNRFKDSGGLVHWAWSLGRDGKDYRTERDRAASAGTLGHELIDAFIHGREPKLPTPEELAATSEELASILEKARNAFEQFLEWHRASRVEIVATEAPLISERHRYGGTLDAIGRVSGALCVLDWKTSNRIYSDYICQIAAYRALWEETHPGDTIARIHLLRIDKEGDSFHHHSWGPDTLEKGLRAFLLMRELYDLDADLKRAAA